MWSGEAARPEKSAAEFHDTSTADDLIKSSSAQLQSGQKWKMSHQNDKALTFINDNSLAENGGLFQVGFHLPDVHH